MIYLLFRSPLVATKQPTPIRTTTVPWKWRGFEVLLLTNLLVMLIMIPNALQYRLNQYSAMYIKHCGEWCNWLLALNTSLLQGQVRILGVMVMLPGVYLP